MTIEAWSKGRLLDDRIEMDSIPCNRLSGHIDMVIKYGKKGREKFELHPYGVVDIVMTEFGFVSHIIVQVV